MNIQTKPIFLLLLLTFFGSSQANVVTINGTNVSFTYEDSLLGLLGTPTVTGDQLFFTPTAFSASATGLTSFDLQHSTINIGVSALNGGIINTVKLIEKGDYISKGGSSHVDAGGQIRVADTTAPLDEVTDFLTLSSPFAQQSNFFPTQNWQASASANALIFGTSKVNVTIENILVALSNAFGDLGFIEKKAVVLGISSVPLPACVWLFGTVLLGFLAHCKRIHYVF